MGYIVKVVSVHVFFITTAKGFKLHDSLLGILPNYLCFYLSC